ncbi:hypothetical protein N0V93_003980 [Gnomoniopsis smithogilvyi]|uniref:Uncharacterized protein n=1 Tax=Gnomoniopsis smithogilvyi TaxID=1191159 RepID=A0A9W8Z1T7_9PEZI|nr:hypothetical protein N0V93_003980 [Gnomoniopsis smithogilvyi]
MKSLSTTSCIAGLLALHFHAVAAAPEPGLFDDIKSDWDDTKAEATSVSGDMQSAWSSGTAAAASATATALTYPGCTDDVSQAWCGIIISGPANDSSFNISITDSRCDSVTTQTGIKENSTRYFDTSVGNWSFGVDGVSGSLNLTYNGRNISDPLKWDTYGYEVVNAAANSQRVFGSITNCTAADDESAAVPHLSMMGAGWMLGAIAAGMFVMS